MVSPTAARDMGAMNSQLGTEAVMRQSGATPRDTQKLGTDFDPKGGAQAPQMVGAGADMQAVARQMAEATGKGLNLNVLV